jgi:AcrR family transcriptional regulator
VTEMRDTREAMLEAGIRLYSSRADELLRGLSAGTVAKEAGFHRQTFYRYWDTHAEYVQDLVRHVLDRDAEPVADGATTLPPPRPADLESFARELAHHDFLRVLEDPRVMLRIGLIVMQAHDRGAPRELAQEYYDSLISQVAEGYESLLEATDRVPAAGMTTRDLARILQALVLGLVLQAKSGEDDPHASVLLERAITALLTTLTEPADTDAAAAG